MKLEINQGYTMMYRQSIIKTTNCVIHILATEFFWDLKCNVFKDLRTVSCLKQN
jgi:hypothetical protein